MKMKLKISDVLFVGCLGLLLCIGISIIAKKAFNIEADFLSTSATLFTAVVALFLYNDWREPYVVNKVDQEQKELRNILKDFRKNYNAFLYFVNVENKGRGVKNGDDASHKYRRLENDLLSDLEEISIRLNGLILIIEDNLSSEKVHIIKLKEHSGNIEKLIKILSQHHSYHEYSKAYKQLMDSLGSKEFTDLGDDIGFNLSGSLNDLYKIFNKGNEKA